MTTCRLLTVDAMRKVDETAIAGGVPGYVLMQAAGAAVAERARAWVPPGGRILILCGPGSNGGDGFVAARLLAASGFGIALRLIGELGRLSGDAALAAADWMKTGASVAPALPAGDVQGFDLIVDALYGAGLSRDIDGEERALIEAINASGTPVLAVDLPSGLDGDSGVVRGAVAQAAETVTFVALKPGHLLQPGRSLCGTLHVADIGTGAPALEAGLATGGPATYRNEPNLWLGGLPRPTQGHKYTRGHALVLSGPAFKTGAARLAARGALRVGAGLVTVVSPSGAMAENAAHLTAIMLRACDGPDDLDDLLTDERLNTVLLGPGLGISEATRDLVAVAASAGRRLILDADALTSFKAQAPLLAEHLSQGCSQAVLTPHEGEFARLFGNTDATADDLSKLERARRAAAIVGGIVVLKGADTVIAAPDGRAAINDHGSPYLGTAGSGDVLGGLIAGLLAQGMPPFEAACVGVWLHGDAGLRRGPGLIAEDIPEMMPEVLSGLLGA